MDGGLDAQTIRLEGGFGNRAVGGKGVIVNCAGPERAGNRIEQACSRQLSSVRSCFPRCRVAVLACELAGLPWSAVNLAKLSLRATGKGNARKPEMQTARGRALDAGRPRDPHPCRALVVTWRVRARSMQESDSGIVRPAFGRSFRRRR